MKVKKLLGKLLGAFLCLGMILGLMPSQALQVKAATEPNYLTFTAEQAGSTLTFTWANEGESVQISTDGGSTWLDYTKGTKITLAQTGDSVKFKGNLTKLNLVYSDGIEYIYPAFTMDGKIAASGSVTSIVDGNGGDPNTPIGDTGLTGMFKNCASLTRAPELPSTSVEGSGYQCMFQNCTNLVVAPELPATSIGDAAYMLMFSGCSNLKTFQTTLPAMLMRNSCYNGMFENCTSLQKIPELPATTLTRQCYYKMFSGCKSLSMTNTKDSTHTLAWKLPATTVPTDAEYWNKDMFKDCDNVDIAEPQVNTTYYQLCQHSYNADDKCIYCGETNPNAAPKPTPEPNPSVPTITEGNNSLYTIGTMESLTFSSNALSSQFVAVLVDGVQVDAANYDMAKGGRIVVRLKQSFLDTLSKGSHTIAIQSTVGTARANFTVSDASGSGNGNGGTTGGTTGNGNGNGSGTGTGNGTGTGSGSATTPTPFAPTAGITDIQPTSSTPIAQNTSNPTSLNVTSPITGEATPLSGIVLAIIIVGGFGLLIVELRKAHKA